MKNKTAGKTTEKVLLMLFKEPFVKHTATSLALAFGITRQGLWKSLKKLSENKMIILDKIGNTTKSAVDIKIQWKNPITLKTLSLLLAKEALEQERWLNNFAEIENYADFVVLFGSILHNSKEAKDIDILAIVNDKKSFKKLDEIMLKIQKTQEKNIHLINLTWEEFKEELRKQNKAYIGALKKGIVLFGQENYIKFIEETIGR